MLADWWPTFAIGGLALGVGGLVALPAAASLIVSRKNAKKKQRADSGPRPQDSAPRIDAAVPWSHGQAPRFADSEPWLDGAEPWRQLDLWDQPARFLAALLTAGYRGSMAWADIWRLYLHWADRQLKPGERRFRESYVIERLISLGCRRDGRLREIGAPGSRQRMQFYWLPAVMTDGLPPAGAGSLPTPGTGDAAEPRSSLNRRLKAVS